MSISSELVTLLRGTFRLDWEGIHGAAHWSRVRANGLTLARLNGANVRVVEYFAFLHDVCRQDDNHDPEHGPRAADFASGIRAEHIRLDDLEFDQLIAAVRGHTHGRHHDDLTIATCWDADRLDLARVGITPDPRRLCTEAARSPDIIRHASSQSLKWLEQYYRG